METPRSARGVWKRQFATVFSSSRRALSLVWRTNRALTVVYVIITVGAAVLPAAVAVVSRHIVDAVVAADRTLALRWVMLEAGVVILLAAAQRAISLCETLLRAQLNQCVSEMILAKSMTLDLPHFEDSEFYDRLEQAQQHANYRPLSLVKLTFGLCQNCISLLTYGAMLCAFSPWAVLLLVVAGMPTFLLELRFSGEAFQLLRWKSPDNRLKYYLEYVMTRDRYAKEVMLYELGEILLNRHRRLFERMYPKDRSLAMRQAGWGWGLGLLGNAAFYGAYAWIVVQTVNGRISLGQMTMYLMLFRQGQAAVTASLSAIGDLYEANLYITDLYDFLDEPTPAAEGTATVGPLPHDGVRFEAVSFRYPDASAEALSNVNLHLRPGEKLALVGENGSGKTTLIKLLTRLYAPTQGRILLDGLDLQAWDQHALRRRIGVIFQDFAQYQFILGENIGVGDVEKLDDRQRWREAATKGMADSVAGGLPSGYDTLLGKWFKDGKELSGGQWQKVALSRAFMRTHADIVVLDEPTAAIDARAEALIFERFRELTRDQMAIIISHRFSTVRMAEVIIVLHHGTIIEQGTHDALMALRGHYAHLFSLQAAGYR